MDTNHHDNEILNFNSQNSFALPPLPTSPQCDLFSFDSPSSYLELHKKLALNHAVENSLLQLHMKPTFIQEKKKLYSRNLHLKKGLTCRIDNEIDD